jgi:hypothetical protein
MGDTQVFSPALKGEAPQKNAEEHGKNGQILSAYVC